MQEQRLCRHKTIIGNSASSRNFSTAGVSSDECAGSGNYRVLGFAQHLISVFKHLFPIFVKGSIDAFEGVDIRPVKIISRPETQTRAGLKLTRTCKHSG
jgi:hypothetical protein